MTAIVRAATGSSRHKRTICKSRSPLYPGGGFGDDLLKVSGRNFTASSVVCVNGRAVQTGFISSGVLTAEAAVEPWDRITVIQRTEDFITLGECEPVLVPDVP